MSSGPDVARDAPTPTWFDVAATVADRLVPELADWVVLHVRECVLELVRHGAAGTLTEAGIGSPQLGESLVMVTLRHRDADLEVVLRRVIGEMAPHVGDPFGSGRVTATGISRLASQVDPSHLRAIARNDQELVKLQALDLGSAVVVPVTAAGVVLGALNVVHGRRGAVDAPDLARAEMWGRRIGDALDSSRSATAHLRTGAERPTADRVWAPIGGEDNPVAAARRWVRRTLPEIVDRAVRPGLADDLDLAVSELAGNAVRHTGELLEVRLGQRGDAVRVGVLDRDDRHPTVRRPAQDSESGRGMMIIELISRSWEVEHRVREGGKLVWAELDL